MWIFHVRYVSTIECVVFRHVQCPSPSLKVPDLWKSTTSWAGSFWGAGVYPDLYLGPGSCGVPAQSP